MDSFIFGGNTGETQDSITRKRRIAEAMISNAPQARDAWSGLANAGAQIAAALIGRGADQSEADLAANRQQTVSQALAAMHGTPEWKNPDNPQETLVSQKPGDKQAAYSMLASSNDPQLSDMALKLQLGDMKSADDENTWQKHFGMQNEADMQRMKAQQAFQADQQARSLAAQRDIAQQRINAQGNFYAIPTSSGYYGMDKKTGLVYPLGVDGDGNMVPTGGPVSRGNPAAIPAQPAPAQPMPAGPVPAQPAVPAQVPPSSPMPVPAQPAAPAQVPAPAPASPTQPAQPATRLMPPSMDPAQNAAVAGAKAAATVQGTTQGAAAANMPATTQGKDYVLGLIDGLQNDPQLPNALGLVGSKLPSIPGYNSGVLAKIEQLQGQNFLQAYQGLKGGGQITEIEGAKAQAAQARLNRAQTIDEFKSALSDMSELVRQRYAVQQEQAGAPTSAPVDSQPPDGIDPTLWQHMTPQERALWK